MSRTDRYWKMSNAHPDVQRRKLEAKIPADRSGCWSWPGQTTQGGYGQMRTGPQARDYVHRISYTLFVGPIPEGAQINHLCRNRACFNPAHLEPVTPRTNFMRGEHPSAVVWRTGMCTKGLHEMSGHNIMLGAGGRRCRACNYAWQNARRQARRALKTAA